MPTAISPGLDTVYTAVKSFILSLLPLDNAHVVKGFPNGVAMPEGPFVAMSAMIFDPLNYPVQSFDATNPAPVAIDITQSVQVSLQLDVYGPSAADWARTLELALRTSIACDALAPACQPLYTNPTHRIPLVDSEQQYEDRWAIEAQIEYDPTISVTQQFASTASITLINVDETYKP